MELLENDLVSGSSGRFGKRLIYRRRGDKTIIAGRPLRRKNPNTLLQQAVREKFAEGIIYANGVVAEDETKTVYQAKVQGNQTAYNLAIRDFCKAPKITRCTIDKYTGQPGDKITIRAVDDFKVESVMLVIKDSADSIIEEGAAILSGNKADWIYTATVVNPALTGTKLIVSAADIPGNVTTQEVVL